MHDDLSQNLEHWLFTQDYVGYTWESWSFITSWGCKNLADKVSENCFKEARRHLVRLDLYLSYGLCISDLASWCNVWIKSSVDKCHQNAKRRGRTINFIVVDYADIGSGRDVIKVAKEENLKNIVHFG